MAAAGAYKVSLGMNGFGWANVIWGHEYRFDSVLDFAAKHRFDGIELFGLPEEYPKNGENQLELRRHIESYGLKVASIQSLPGGLGNGSPASSYSVCRRQYTDYIKCMLDMAVTLQSDSLGVWAGELLGDGPSEKAAAYMVDVYGRCAELAADASLPLCLEAEPVQLVNAPDVWFKILRGVNSPYLKAICDFAHINILSGGQPLTLLAELLPFIGHTHLCGSDGCCTNFESCSSRHLALGEGSMDWNAALTALLDGGYAGWLDIDLWEHRDPFSGAEKGKSVLDAYLRQRASCKSGA